MSRNSLTEVFNDETSSFTINTNEHVTNELPSDDLTCDHVPPEEDGGSGTCVQSGPLSTGQHSSMPASTGLHLNGFSSLQISPYHQQNRHTTNNVVFERNSVPNYHNSVSTNSLPNGNIVGSSAPGYCNVNAQDRAGMFLTPSRQNSEDMQNRITRRRYCVDLDQYVTVSELYEEPMDESVEPVPAAGEARTVNTHKLRDERKRLNTFAGQWPDKMPPQINPSVLSKDGFYYVGPFDRVCCIFCNGVLKKWDVTDTVRGEHKKHFPSCPFVLGLEVGNIPLDNSHSSMTKSDSFGVLPVQNLNKPLNETPRELAENLGIVQNKPKHPRFSLESDRLATFRYWPSQMKQQPEEMARAGLFYVGSGDKVRCFTCDGLLHHWEPEDDPWIEHARWFPDCQFVRLVKGDKFIKQVLRGETPVQEKDTETNSEKEHQQNSAAIQALLEEGCTMQEVSEAIKWLHENGGVPDDVIPKAEQIFEIILDKEKTSNSEVMNGDFPEQRRTTNSKQVEDISALLEENRELKEQKVCKICLDNEISIIFLPCGHLVCCSTCASSVTECPICRAAIRGTAKAFWS